jgi:two-component system, OmpR family, alkaline phosphatase synthesis response regulator PhoP
MVFSIMLEQRYKILVIDDDEDILYLLKYNFEKEGFVVKTISNSNKALKIAREFLPDLIILDIMMPTVNGLTICSQLRSNVIFQDTYIFFLTACSASRFETTAFRIGGDDYIEKMMGLRSLINKVNCVIKRKLTIRKSVARIEVGDLKISRLKKSVTFKNQRIDLNAAEFELLYFLAQNPNKDITTREISFVVPYSGASPDEASVRLQLQNLRTKLSPELFSPGSGNALTFR